MSFSIELVGDQLAASVRYDDATGKVVKKQIYLDGTSLMRGQVYHFDIKALFDDAGDGRLVLARDGKVIADYSGPLGYTSQASVSWSEGIKRTPDATETIALEFANMSVSSGADVAMPATTTFVPAPTIGSARVGLVDSTGEFVIRASGLAPALSTVSFYIDGALVGQTTIGTNGRYSAALPVETMGAHRLVAVTSGEGGHQGTASAPLAFTLGTANDPGAKDWGNFFLASNGETFTTGNSRKSWSVSAPDDDTLRFEVRDRDVAYYDFITKAASERSEVRLVDEFSNGVPLEIAYRFNIEPGARNDAAWVVLGQLHQNDVAGAPPWSPPFEIGLVGERMVITVRYTGANGKPVAEKIFSDTVDIVRGHYYDIDIKAVFDPDGAGRIVMTRDGVTIADYSGKLGYVGYDGVYWQEGIYRHAGAVLPLAANYKDLTVTTGQSVVFPGDTAPTGSVRVVSTIGPDAVTLLALQNLVDPDTPVSAISWHWRSSADGTMWRDIAGATGATLESSAAFAGQFLQAVATYTDAFGVHSVASLETIGFGGSGNDTLTGSEERDILAGFAANDTLEGGGGNDLVYGGYGRDSLSGGAGADRLFSDGGDDILNGGADNDMLSGGAGGDRMSGEAGNDTYVVDNAGDTTFEVVGQGNDTVFAVLTYALAAGQSVERLATTLMAGTTAISLTGNELGQRLDGNAGTNVLNGRGGADLMSGYGGNDTYVVDNAGDMTFEVVDQGYDTVFADLTYALAAGQLVERLATTLMAGSTAISLTGNELGQRLDGNAGTNVLNGRGGADRMSGYGGNDTFFVDNAGDTTFEVVDQGYDTVFTSLSYALAAGQSVERLATTLMAGSTAISLTGNELGQRLDGNAGTNVLNGRGGADRMSGYGGNDTYVVDNAGDIVDETQPGSSGIDHVQTSIHLSLNAATMKGAIENVTLLGTAGIYAVGNALNNVVFGNSGDNAINGMAGSDTINAGLGADRLIGGAGMDFMTGGGDNDTFVFTALAESGATTATADRILDLLAGDKIDLLAIDADTGIGGDQGFQFDQNGSFSAGEIRQNILGTDLQLDFNTDADATPEMSIVLINHGAVGSTDFFL